MRAALIGVLLLAGTARADPIVTLPPLGRGTLVSSPDCPGAFGLTGEVRGLGVMGARDATTLPDYGGIEGNYPELGAARLGLVGVHARLPLAAVLRVDFAELTRIDADTWRDRPLASGDRLLDDALVWWRPEVWAGLIVGRQKVPFSRFRQVDEALLTAGVTPFVIDRLAPQRRWGVTGTGDLGALAWATGVFVDTARLELRTDDDPATEIVDDPSTRGRAMLAAHMEWTPRAPIGADHQATPSGDPWWRTTRVSAGVGVLWRGRAGADRWDLTGSVQAKHSRLAGLVELILSGGEPGQMSADVAAEAGVLVTDRVLLFARADTDVVVDQRAAGGGATWFVTPDRRNKVTFHAWARRRGDGEPRGDGAVAELQAAF